jgi:hypothetical protein
MLRQILIPCLLLGWSVAYAQPAKQIFTATGKEVHDAMLSPGTWTCVGGQPTGQMPPCSADTKRILVRGVSSRLVYSEVFGSAAPMLAGTNVTNVRGELDGNYYGHLSCTFEWTIPEMGGRWEGTCSLTGFPLRGLAINRAIGRGHGGKLEGLTLEFYEVYMEGQQAAIFVAAIKDE